jgi:hypothetical protein
MGVRFDETRLGRTYYESQVPRAVNALERIAVTLERSTQPVLEPKVTTVDANIDAATLGDALYYLQGLFIVDSEYMEPDDVYMLQNTIRMLRETHALALDAGIPAPPGPHIKPVDYAKQAMAYEEACLRRGKLDVPAKPRNGQYEPKLTDPNGDYSAQLYMYNKVTEENFGPNGPDGIPEDSAAFGLISGIVKLVGYCEWQRSDKGTIRVIDTAGKPHYFSSDGKVIPGAGE